MLKLKKNLTETITHIWTDDPAIDSSSPEFNADKYIETGDEKYLPMKEGEEPTRFRIAPLTRKQWLEVSSQGGLTAQVDVAVAYALRGVENLEINGSPLHLETEPTSKGNRVKQEYLDQIWDPSLMTELGARIISISRLNPL